MRTNRAGSADRRIRRSERRAGQRDRPPGQIDWLMGPDLPDGRPNSQAVAQSHARIGFEPFELTAPAAQDLLAELIRMRSADFVLAAGLRATVDDRTLRWFVSHRQYDGYGFFRRLLGSAAARSALPDLAIPRPLAEDPPLRWSRTGVLTLDGELGMELCHGSAYRRYDGTPAQAKRIGAAFVDELVGDRHLDFDVFRTNQPWTPWFHGIDVVDMTWAIVDRGRAEVILICLTDSD